MATTVIEAPTSSPKTISDAYAQMDDLLAQAQADIDTLQSGSVDLATAAQILIRVLQGVVLMAQTMEAVANVTGALPSN